MSDDTDRIPLEELAPAEVSEIDLYQRREKIYTRRIQGFYQRLRLFTGWPLLIAYFLVPWLTWGDRPLVLFDIPARQFHVLGLTFWPQDFRMLAWLLMIAAFGLFFVTVIAGRVWCGYTCPQTVWTAIFMWIEQKTEGSRNQRMKLDRAPWNPKKVLKKGSKHGLWIGFALLTGITFVGYFMPIRDLIWHGLHWNLHPWAVFWVGFFTWTTYVNAGWLREQVCLYMCPYARFQSVMFDKDTLIVSYDPKRGEPRGPRKRNADPRALGLGDCIDCRLCVQVCPTGIDIRNGLQYECITCALCVDACNSVMDKMGYPRGLIRYTTEHQLAGGKTHWLRPRPIGYALAILGLIGLLLTSLAQRVPLELDIIRDRNNLFLEAENGRIQNVYTLKIVNMDPQPHTYRISADGLPGLRLDGENPVTLKASEVRSLPLRLSADSAAIPSVANTVYFTITATDDPSLTQREEARFIGPQQR